MLRPVITIVLAVCMLNGCAAVPGFEDLSGCSIQVLDAQVLEQSAQGGQVVLFVRVTNPNPQELPIPRVTCDLDVEGGGRFTFTDVPYATLPGGGKSGGEPGGGAGEAAFQILEIPGALAGSALAGKRYTVRGTVVFQPDGQLRRVFTDLGLPLPRTRFAGSGTLTDATGGVTTPAVD